MNKLEFQAITWSFLKARKKSRLQGVIGFGFASHWLKNWRAIFAPTSYFRKSFENCSVVKKKKIETAIKFVLNNVKHCNLETCANSRLILCGKCYQDNVFFLPFSFYVLWLLGSNQTQNEGATGMFSHNILIACILIGHFPVHFSLYFKANLSAKSCMNISLNSYCIE